MNLTDITTVKSLFRKYNFHTSKGFGQNFLINPQVLTEIVHSSGIDKTTGVIEIGPGIGVLTKELCNAAQKVVAVEIDQRLLPILEETLEEFDNVSVVLGDILKMDLKEFIKSQFDGMDVCVCANLPYYITTPIVMKLLEEKLPIKSITLMVQKEVALRLCAIENSKDYGAISLSVRYYSEPELKFFVQAKEFLPMPKVDSAVVHFKLLDEPRVSVNDEKFLFRMIKAGFSQRRKTLANSLSNMSEFDKVLIENCLIKMGKPVNIRGEQLSLEDYAQLCNLLKTASF